jgi:hypothetical protein
MASQAGERSNPALSHRNTKCAKPTWYGAVRKMSFSARIARATATATSSESTLNTSPLAPPPPSRRRRRRRTARGGARHTIQRSRNARVDVAQGRFGGGGVVARAVSGRRSGRAIGAPAAADEQVGGRVSLPTSDTKRPATRRQQP